MKPKLVLFISFLPLAAYSSAQYVPAGEFKNSATVEEAMYSTVVPAISVSNNEPWKRFTKSGNLNDQVLVEGWQDESYAATVSVKINSSAQSTADLTSKKIEHISLKDGALMKTSQKNVLCVGPVMGGEVNPYPVGSLFILVVGCVDIDKKNYYELEFSWKIIDDRATRNSPPDRVLTAANQFFSDFKVK